MFDFMCMGCGIETSADPTDYHFDVDGDTATAIFELRCPKCGRVHKCRENFYWDGITHME